MSASSGIWIQGAGELASATAVVLVRAGYRVVMAEIARPLAVRRLICFAEAVYGGAATVAGIPGRLASVAEVGFGPGLVQVVVDPDGTALPRLRPRTVVDARMTKRVPSTLPLGPGMRLIGLGPGFTCGQDADLVIETHREAGPGRLIEQGAAAPDTGVPGPVGGQTRARLLRAPAAGNLEAHCAIGELVAAGQTIGRVGGLAVVSGLCGMLRGLVHERAELSVGMKVGDVDPRGALVDPRALTDKGLAIGDGVLRALRLLDVLPAEVGSGQRN